MFDNRPRLRTAARPAGCTRQPLAAYLARLPAPGGPDHDDPLRDTAPPGVAFSAQLRAAGLLSRFSLLLAAHALETALFLTSWVFVGSGALSGRLDYGWLAAWTLCLAGTVPLRLSSRWLGSVIALGFSGLLKQRLLAGAINIDADLMRCKGGGRLFGEVLEVEAIERLGVSGGIETVLSAVELLLVFIVLAWGAAATAEMGVLGAWAGLSVLLIAQNTRRRDAWTKLRLELTHRMVESMSAHRTRLAQQSPAEWHLDEDLLTAGYAEASEAVDRSAARLEAALPRGYVIAAFLALAPSFLAGSATLAQLAVTLGAVLFAGAAFERLAFGIGRGTAAWIAWRSVKSIFDAAPQSLGETPAAGSPPPAGKVLQAQDLVFTHPGRAEPVLKACTLSIERGDLLLLEGKTASGKSTLAALLAGFRRPSSGFILAGGLDRQTLGDAAWRRRIAAAPQYHENHILAASLGFNLLLSRPYPHTEADLREARELCRELGLGPLLERMPGGLDQMVGDTGWQLSQGERSRVFLARALLQNPELVILDESLAALDPENLRQCLECVIRRAKTLLVIAHP